MAVRRRNNELVAAGTLKFGDSSAGNMRRASHRSMHSRNHFSALRGRAAPFGSAHGFDIFVKCSGRMPRRARGCRGHGMVKISTV